MKQSFKKALYIIGAFVVLTIAAGFALKAYDVMAADVKYKVIRGVSKRLRDMGDTSHANVVSEGRKANLSVILDFALSADSYRVLVDLSDTTNYAHLNTSGITVIGSTVDMAVSAGTAQWAYLIYVCTVIDGSGSTLRIFDGILTSAAGQDTHHRYWEYPGAGMDILDVVGADVAVASITTSTDLDSPAGTTQAGVGDIILFTWEIGGTATMSGYAGVFYYTY